jgi:Zn-dependent protease
MSKCYHCGRETDELYYCEDCKHNYCRFHKEPIDHECKIVQEELGIQQQQQFQYNTPSPSYSETEYRTPRSETSPTSQTQGSQQEFIWYRRERNIPENAFDADSGIEFKGILLAHKPEILHFLIGGILIYIIGLLGFYSPKTQEVLNERGYGWIIFMVAGIYTTAFLFHELGHRQVALHYGLQSKFRLLKFGMMITVFGLVMGLVSVFSGAGALPALALPGAVVVLGLDTIDKRTGLTKAAGPFINLVYGTVLLISSFFIPIYPINYFIASSASINFMLGAFNLIPLGILDGKAIFQWRKSVYFLMIIIMVVLLVTNYVIILFQQEIYII